MRIFLFQDPVNDVNWQASSTPGYNITAIPTKCPGGARTLMYTPNSFPSLDHLENGCEYRIFYAAKCQLPDGSYLTSNNVEYIQTVCTGENEKRQYILTKSFAFLITVDYNCFKLVLS